MASRLAEELLPEVRSGALRLTIIGREDRAAYQRIRIGDVSVGRVEPEDLVMNDIASLQAEAPRSCSEWRSPPSTLRPIPSC